MTSGNDGDRPLTYRNAGVDIDAGNDAVRRIRAMVARTRRPEQLDELGGFAGMMSLPSSVLDPVLVSCADGVGTKLLISIAANKHDTVGIDLVAMNVNDLVCCGAEPLFLLDYIACGQLDPSTVESIVSGIVEGCTQAGCSLLGGETAELPGMYAVGHYDLAAFAVGVVPRGTTWGPHRATEGDDILAFPSTGLHSNGFSLARRALLDPEFGGLSLEDTFPGTNESVASVLLTPTAIYVKPLLALRGLDSAVHAVAHITGGGLIENPPRAYGDTLAAELDLGDIELPPVFSAIAAQGVPPDEMRRTFNLGIGMLLMVDRDRTADIQRMLAAVGQPCVRVGSLVARETGPAVRFS